MPTRVAVPIYKLKEIPELLVWVEKKRIRRALQDCWKELRERLEGADPSTTLTFIVVNYYHISRETNYEHCTMKVFKKTTEGSKEFATIHWPPENGKRHRVGFLLSNTWADAAMESRCGEEPATTVKVKVEAA